jgi:hypothetical protein
VISEQVHSTDWRTEGIALFAGRFLVRPSVLPDESFPGYCLRVAFANGLSNPSWLDCLAPYLPKAYGIARWCPTCLGESGCYWHEGWHCGPAACFKHRCWLSSSCNGCHRMLRWKHVRFAECTCGAPLQDARVRTFSTELQQLIADRSDSNIETLTVGERWSLARLLGALAQYGLQGKPLKKATRRTEDIEQLLVTAGASLIADQSACFELLDRLRAPQTGVNNVPLLSQVFPHLLTIVRKQLNEADRRWMLDLLDAYVASSSHHGSAVIWERKGAVGLHSRQNKRNPAIATMLAQTGVTVPVRQTRAGRQKFVISHADLQRLQKTQRSLVSRKTAARYAGISASRVQALVKAGSIASTKARIDMRSVDSLLGSIVAACVHDAPAFEDPISVADALRLYVPVDASGEFFNRLMNGAVRIALGQDKVPALQGIFADRGEVISAAQLPVESGSKVSIVEAARRLGVKQEVMYHLINIGLVRTRTGKLRRRAARVVDVEDLQKFTEQFLPLFTVAKTIGISAREAPGWARQHGIEIVTGPSVDGGRQYWVRRQASMAIASVGREA